MVIRAGASKVRVRRSDKLRDDHLFIGTLGVNCTRYTRRCIDTVETNCREVTFFYLDNGSNEDSVAEIKSWKKNNPSINRFMCGFNGRNAGVAVGWNQLAKLADQFKATKLLICNNDINFGPYTIDGLIDAYDQLKKHDDRTVMVTATNHTKNPDELPNIKPVWKYHEHPDFSCFLVTLETFDKIGMFDPQYDPAFFEDNDYHWRILLEGYKAYGTDWAPYSHIASRTRHENPELVPHLKFRENKIKFYRKMVTDSVDQEIAVQRYNHWLKHHPDIRHPSFEDVINFAENHGLVKDGLNDWLDNLTVWNVPN